MIEQPVAQIITGLRDAFSGNVMTAAEKRLRVKQLREELEYNQIDGELIPYLVRINRFPFIATTQSCCGHGGHRELRSGRKSRTWAHIDFRSGLTPAETIDWILRPLYDRFPEENEIRVDLALECGSLRYVVWLSNDIWRTQLDYLMCLLSGIALSRQTEEERR
jgi:hypothetical protein